MVFNLIAKGYTAWKGGKESRKMAEATALATQQAMEAKRAAQRRGLAAQEEGYSDALGYLEPYNDQRYAGLLADTAGLNGPEGQAAALENYRGNPSYNLLQDVLGEASRVTAGAHAAGGAWNSGGHITELGRRLSDITLSDYGKYRGFLENRANQSQNVASNMSTVAQNRGNALARTHTGIGDTEAAGILGRTNALNQGTQASLNYLTPFVGAAGEYMNDLARKFIPGGAPNDASNPDTWQTSVV